MINVADVLGWVEIVGWGLIFWGFLTILGMIGAIGKFLDKIPGLGGLGGGSADLSPIMKKMEEMEEKMNKGFGDVNTNVGKVQATVEDVRNIVLDIQASIEKIVGYMNQWEAYFKKVFDSLGQLESVLTSGLSALSDEHKAILESIEKRSEEFKQGLEIIMKQIDEKFENFHKEFESLVKNVEAISKDIIDIKTSTSLLVQSIEKIRKAISKLPSKSQLKAELEATLKVLMDKLAQIEAAIKDLEKDGASDQALLDEIKKIAESIKSHNEATVKESTKTLMKKLEDISRKIAKIRSGAGGGKGDQIGLGNVRDIKNDSGNVIVINGAITKEMTEMVEKLGVAYTQAKNMEKKTIGKASVAAATRKSLVEIEEVTTLTARKYEEEKGKITKHVKESLKVAINERKYIMREFAETKEIISAIKKGQNQKAVKHLRILKRFVRREEFRAGVSRLAESINKFKDMLQDPGRVDWVLKEMAALQATTIVDSAEKLKLLLENKKANEINWKQAGAIAVYLEKVISAWDSLDIELTKIIKEVASKRNL